MTLLNAALALGTLALFVPLAIHLLHRSRFRSMPWGAMFLLQDVVKANRRRMQWHQWILLALRCAIPVLLALAMARPLLSSLRSVPDSQPMSVVLVMDDSRSMQAATRQTLAIDAASDFLETLRRGDEVMLVRSSRPNELAGYASAADVRRTIGSMTFDHAPLSWDTIAQATIEACRNSSHPHMRVVVISDFQESDDFTSGMAALSQGLDRLPQRPQVDWLPIRPSTGNSTNEIGNVLVSSVEYEGQAILVGRSTRLRARIENDSDRPANGLQVQWTVNEEVVHTQLIDLKPRQSESVAWSYRPDSVGAIEIACSVQHVDTLPADNHRMILGQVLGPIEVWLIDGDPSAQPLEGETDFLKFGLSPFAFRSIISEEKKNRRKQVTDVVNASVFSVRQFAKAFEKAVSSDSEAKRPDVIVLANVADPDRLFTNTKRKNEPSSPKDGPLAEFIDAGGAVMFFDGDRVESERWSSVDWLPAKLSTIDEAATATNGFRVRPPGNRFDAWSILGDEEGSLFDDVQIAKARSLELNADSLTLLESESGHPLVVQGENGVVQFAVSCDAQWSNLPLRGVYLPMMQQLILYVAGQTQRLEVPLGQSVIFGNPRRTSQPWQLTTPEGGRSFLTPSKQNLDEIVGPPAYARGVYRLQQDSYAQLRMAEVPAHESNLRVLPDEQIAAMAEQVGARVFSDIAGLQDAAQVDRFGREIWRWLLWVLLAVMVGELLWQQWLPTRSGRTAKWSFPLPRAA